MTVTGRPRLDVTAVRHDHRIEVVVAASGVELTGRGQGFMGCCPFHEDSTPSLSVGGVPDRFHCFGCGAGGDVIEYVHRFTGLSFTGAIQALAQGTAFGEGLDGFGEGESGEPVDVLDDVTTGPAPEAVEPLGHTAH